MMKESKHSLQGAKQAIQAGDAQKIWTPPVDLREGFFKKGWEKGSQGAWSSCGHSSVCLVMRSLGVNIFNLVPSCLRSMYMPVVSMQLNFNSWVSVSETQLKDMTQNVICSPWGGKSLDYAWWWNYFYVVPFACFSLFLPVLISLIKLTLWPKFFHRQKECRGHERQGP